MPDTTLFVLSGEGVTPYSARGISQTLAHIAEAAVMRRTWNGNLRDISRAAFRKYISTVSCTDQQAPALEGIWPGQQVTVDCVCELAYLTRSAPPDRVVVASRVEGDYTFYRLRLTMRVKSYSTTTDEYGATVAWTLELEEE